jgi:PASTA domain-containing protein
MQHSMRLRPVRIGLLAVLFAAGALVALSGAPAAYAGPPPATVTPPVNQLYIVVPDVLGNTRSDAEHILVKSGLTVGQVTTVPDCDHLDLVLAQDPRSGAIVLKGSAVALSVGGAPLKGGCP